MDTEGKTRFLFAGFGGKMELISRGLTQENARPFDGRGRKPEETEVLGEEGGRAPFPRGYISTTTYELFFEGAGASGKTEWKPPVQRWLESRAKKRQGLVPKWRREEAEEGKGREAPLMGKRGASKLDAGMDRKRMHIPRKRENNGYGGRVHLVGIKR